MHLKKSIHTLALCLLLACPAKAEKPLLWNMDRLYTVKSDETYSKVKSGFVWNAKSFLDSPSVILTDKPTKFVSDPRYYVSVGTYWWPNPDNPGGPYIRKDGLINPETRDYDAPKLSLMMRRVKAFAVAFYLTDDFVYKDAMVSQLQAWFLDPVTGMIPTFQYAQIHPGLNGNIGSPAGLIEAYAFNDVLDAIRLVNSQSSIDRKTMDGMKTWFGNFAQWMMESYLGKAEYYSSNNHGIAYDVLLANIAAFIGRKDITDSITGDFLWMRLESQIMPDGSQPMELSRTRSYHYVLYNIVHIIDFCILQENLGNKYYQKNKEIIDSAILWVEPYVGHPEAWTWVENKSKWADEDKIFKTEIQRLKRLKPKKNKTFDFNKYGVDPFENIASVLK
jgi:hypothetical protein